MSHHTLLNSEEVDALIPQHVTTKEELNLWEYENILLAYRWAFSDRNLRNVQPASEAFWKILHYKMFNKSWKWAGKYRTSDKNIGIPFYQITSELRKLEDDVGYWQCNTTFPSREIAVRLHHRLVYIHPFPNGNGRHARLVADMCVEKSGERPFSWGKKQLNNTNIFRKEYIIALKEADNGDFDKLLQFADS